MDKKHSIQHLAFIMDGNRRWAKKNGKSTSDGHKAGLKTMGEILEPLFYSGIPVISLYAFSLDNWNRDPSEVNFLHGLIKEFYLKELDQYKQKEVRVCISGVNDFLSTDTIGYLKDIQMETQHFQKYTLNICFNYSSKREIVEAAKSFAVDVLRKEKNVEDMDIELFKNYLFIPNLPDVDLVIRTSGEQRVSDFLLYQSAYAEYYFTDILWPDLTLDDINKAIDNFSTRHRRFGGV